MTRAAHISCCLFVIAWCWGGCAGDAYAGQLAALFSPGQLARAHADLEGVRNCAACHEAGRKVTVTRCLSCHKPIADRIARRVGVHRDAGADCVSCHVEHAGRDGELRRMNVTTFNHTAETGFALDGKHASLAKDCVSCHTQRSFLDARTSCASCHEDVHKGSLGSTCTTCHSTSVAFSEADTSFDHSRARFPLTGAHRPVACVNCHSGPGRYRGLTFDTCAACHTSPHRTALAPTCVSCHVTGSWSTRKVVHDKTRFPLVGSHAEVACVGCHTTGDMTKPVKFGECSLCHVNVHRESITEDCGACHTETSFHVTGPMGPAATFDHAARTGWALEGKHAVPTCQQCHKNVSDTSVPLAEKVVDYSGARTECISCHVDEHEGEFGLACQACHSTQTFDVKGFKHPRRAEFFGGEHADLTCVSCHVPEGRLRPARVGAPIVAASSPVLTCASCHSDVHLGQFSSSCEACHAVTGARFAAVGFSHSSTTFDLTGRHVAIECVACHKTETGPFPARAGTATRFAPMASACQACHADPHMGQMTGGCETCHDTGSFSLPNYEHEGMGDFFGGFHGRLECASCHRREIGTFPSGQGTAIRYQVGRTCAACHKGF